MCGEKKRGTEPHVGASETWEWEQCPQELLPAPSSAQELSDTTSHLTKLEEGRQAMPQWPRVSPKLMARVPPTNKTQDFDHTPTATQIFELQFFLRSQRGTAFELFWDTFSAVDATFGIRQKHSQHSGALHPGPVFGFACASFPGLIVWRTVILAAVWIPGAWLPCWARGSKRQCGCQHPHEKGHGGARQPGKTDVLGR